MASQISATELPESIRNLFQPYVPGRPAHYQRTGSRKPIQRLLAAQGNQCALCGSPMRFDRSCRSMAAATLEHVKPRCLGGRRPGNLVLAHRRCNERKGDRMPRPCELLYLAAVNLRLADGNLRTTPNVNEACHG